MSLGRPCQPQALSTASSINRYCAGLVGRKDFLSVEQGL